MQNEIKVSVILLAAGLSRRMGEDKLLLDYYGKPILQHSLDMMYELPVYERIIVTSNDRLERITLPSSVRVFVNSQSECGISRSIQLGVEVATGSHYLFLAADQPKLKVSDLMPLLEAADKNPDKIIHPIVDSKPCSPTLFPGVFKKDLLSLQTTLTESQNDRGGRTIRDANKHLCIAVEPECPENYIDIDNVEDFIHLSERKKEHDE